MTITLNARHNVCYCFAKQLFFCQVLVNMKRTKSIFLLLFFLSHCIHATVSIILRASMLYYLSEYIDVCAIWLQIIKAMSHTYALFATLLFIMYIPRERFHVISRSLYALLHISPFCFQLKNFKHVSFLYNQDDFLLGFSS